MVLDTLSPAERLSFVLHDMFAVPFEEIAAIIDRSPAAARQLASRARRRVQGAAPSPTRTWTASARWSTPSWPPPGAATSSALVAVLDPDVVLRAQTAGGLRQIQGAAEVAGEALFWSRTLGRGLERRPVLVNGAAGVVAYRRDGSPVSLMGCTVVDGRIVAIDIIADRSRLATMDIPEAG